MNATKTAPAKTAAPDRAWLFEALLDAQGELQLLAEHFAEVTVPSQTARFGAITILERAIDAIQAVHNSSTARR